MAEKPKRIQRKRTKGWRMPPNTVYVGRGTKWGNPYKAEKGHKGQALLAKGYYQLLIEKWINENPKEHNLSELKGKNLVCWCPLDGQPCHADVLLELANKKGE